MHRGHTEIHGENKVKIMTCFLGIKDDNSFFIMQPQVAHNPSLNFEGGKS